MQYFLIATALAALTLPAVTAAHGAASPRMAVTMIAGMAGVIATVLRAARRHALNGRSVLPVQREPTPTARQHALRARRQCAAAIPDMANTLTGTMTVSDANDPGGTGRLETVRLQA